MRLRKHGSLLRSFLCEDRLGYFLAYMEIPFENYMFYWKEEYQMANPCFNTLTEEFE